MINKDPKIVIFGAGAIGGSAGAWIAQYYENIYFVARDEKAKVMRDKGIITYCIDQPENRELVPVKVIGNLNEVCDADVIVIAVKNYNLEAVAKDISMVTGDRPIIIAMQNGIENQQILPKYFSKVIYCVIGYNAWIDEPGVIGYQKKGPLLLGILHHELQEELNNICNIFNPGVKTIVAENFQDAAHSKLIINLTNSLTTLIGYRFKEISEQTLVQKLFANLLFEGVRIIQAAGFKEYKIDGMPSWRKITMLAKLPQFITKGTFKASAQKMVMSSMAQDIIQRGGHDSELESINGYVMALAEQYGIKAPYNRTVYELCKQEFAKPKFTPMDVTEVWGRVQEE